MLNTLKIWSDCNHLGYHGDLILNSLPKGELVIINTALSAGCPPSEHGEDQRVPWDQLPQGNQGFLPPLSRVLGLPEEAGEGRGRLHPAPTFAPPTAMLLGLN